MASKKIVLVDDHSIVRMGIKAIFSQVPDIDVAFEATNGQEAIDILRGNPVDGVLLDISMPGRSGLDVLRNIRSNKPELPVLVFSMHTEETHAANALKAGANGYFAKGGSGDELIVAMRAVLAGDLHLGEGITAKLADSVTGGGPVAPHEQLSTREFEVYIKLASGLGNSEIAEQLFLSTKTVATHRARILKKMGMQTTAELTYYAIKNRLME